MTFGERLKSQRAGRDVKTLAKQAGMSFSVWYEIERDEASTTVDRLPLIAAALGCKVTDLVPDSETILTGVPTG